MGNFVNFWQIFGISIYISINIELQITKKFMLTFHIKLVSFKNIDQLMRQNLSNLVRMNTDIWFLPHNSAIFWYVPVIWHNWAKKGPNMGVTVPQALVGGWGPRPPQKFGHWS